MRRDFNQIACQSNSLSDIIQIIASCCCGKGGLLKLNQEELNKQILILSNIKICTEANRNKHYTGSTISLQQY